MTYNNATETMILYYNNTTFVVTISSIAMECVEFMHVWATEPGRHPVWKYIWLWNAICAGDMVMDGSYTFSWNFFH